MPVQAVSRGALAAAPAGSPAAPRTAQPGHVSLPGPTPTAGLADQGATRDAAASLPRQPINF
jgi:hypothetical protein